MKIRNATAYDTRQIRALVLRVMADELDVEHRKRLVIDVRYKRANSHTLGRATYGHKIDAGDHGCWVNAGRSMDLFLPRDGEVDRVALAQTIAHECAHLRGLRHAEMRTPRYDYVEGWRGIYAWAEAMPIDRRVPKPGPTPEDRVAAKLEAARWAVARWEGKAKLARTKLRIWTRRLRAQETRLAAMRAEGGAR